MTNLERAEKWKSLKRKTEALSNLGVSRRKKKLRPLITENEADTMLKLTSDAVEAVEQTFLILKIGTAISLLAIGFCVYSFWGGFKWVYVSILCDIALIGMYFYKEWLLKKHDQAYVILDGMTDEYMARFKKKGKTDAV